MFELHPTLLRDTAFVVRLELCQVLLSKDSQYPWCILVPEREGVEEIHQLSEPDRQLLMEESCMLAELMTNLFAPDKMNVAALGNVVPQLHVHHVARFKTDVAWPAPIWGQHDAVPYEGDAMEQRIHVIKSSLEMLANLKEE